MNFTDPSLPHVNHSYCPGGPDSDFEYSTQSYTGYEPTSMRAIRARYNPYLQAKHRLEQVLTSSPPPLHPPLFLLPSSLSSSFTLSLSPFFTPAISSSFFPLFLPLSLSVFLPFSLRHLFLLLSFLYSLVFTKQLNNCMMLSSIPPSFLSCLILLLICTSPALFFSLKCYWPTNTQRTKGQRM